MFSGFEKNKIIPGDNKSLDQFGPSGDHLQAGDDYLADAAGSYPAQRSNVERDVR